MHTYEVRPRQDKKGVNLISDQLPFGRLWYGGENAVDAAVGYAGFYSRAHETEVTVYDDAGFVIENLHWSPRRGTNLVI